jgi:D-proline reductase (dithiol) PrdB
MCCWSVGLVQRAIEAAGMTTVTLSTIPDFTRSVGAPRVVGIEYPQGRTFGQPGDAEGQTAVLKGTLSALKEMERPGIVVDLPFEWPEPPGKVRSHPRTPPPIVSHIKWRPWLFVNFLTGRIPD